jgi:NAD(P)-dependent dehydrogenase (short-subunit alcohol dehydrogenase family)
VNEFENKVAIVTGTTGIGRAIAKRLVSGGASVTACGIDEAANRELLQESDSSGYELRVELCDVSRPEQVQAMVARTTSQFGGLDFIANSAGLLTRDAM